MLHRNQRYFALNSRRLAVLAIAAGSLAVTGCGQSSAPEADKAQEAADALGKFLGGVERTTLGRSW